VSEGSARPERARRAPTNKTQASVTKPPTPDVSIVIPTYRRAERLPGVMEALRQQTIEMDRFEVIAVDNFSQDDTWEMLLVLAATVPFSMRVLQTTFNRGPAPARNLGWRSSEAPVVVFLDDDCLPEPDWLHNGLAAMQADESLGVLQGGVCLPHDFDPRGMPTWYHTQTIAGPTPFFEACNIFYRHAALEDAGGFDESIGWWGEDTVLGWQVVERGWGRGFAGDATVVHSVVERGWRYQFDNALLDRNLVRMARQHPGFRREAFWRPWAVQPEHALFMLAVLGVVGALRFRPALLLALPYLWLRKPHWDYPNPLRYVAESVVLDAAHCSGTLRGAVESRVLVI
jgi:glycosyltransferase involved in cell wall biosynthesis